MAVALVAAGMLVPLRQSAPAAPTANACAPRLAQVVGTEDSAGRPAYIACVPDGGTEARVEASAAAHDDRVSSRRRAELGRITAAAFGSSSAQTGGFVWDDQQVVNLPGRLCRYLDRTVYTGARPVEKKTAWAFKNLTHE